MTCDLYVFSEALWGQLFAFEEQETGLDNASSELCN